MAPENLLGPRAMSYAATFGAMNAAASPEDARRRTGGGNNFAPAFDKM